MSARGYLYGLAVVEHNDTDTSRPRGCKLSFDELFCSVLILSRLMPSINNSTHCELKHCIIFQSIILSQRHIQTPSPFLLSLFSCYSFSVSGLIYDWTREFQRRCCLRQRRQSRSIAVCPRWICNNELNFQHEIKV